MALKHKDEFILITDIFDTSGPKVNELDAVNYKIRILKTVDCTKTEALWETINPWQVLSQKTRHQYLRYW